MKLTTRQKLLIPIIIIAFIYIGWQLYDLFISPAMVKSQPSQSVVTQVAKQQIQPQVTVPEKKPVTDLMQGIKTNKQQPLYDKMMNQYRALQAKRMLLQEELEIAKTKQQISQLSAKLAQFGGNGVASPSFAKTQAEFPYTLLYLDFQSGRWSASLNYRGQAIEVRSGTLLPDNSLVTAINSNAVYIRHNGKLTRLTFHGAVTIKPQKKSVRPLVIKRPVKLITSDKATLVGLATASKVAPQKLLKPIPTKPPIRPSFKVESAAPVLPPVKKKSAKPNFKVESAAPVLPLIKKKPIIKSIKPIKVKKPIPVKTNFKVKTVTPVLPAVKKKLIIKPIKPIKIKKPIPVKANFRVKTAAPVLPAIKKKPDPKPIKPIPVKTNFKVKTVTPVLPAVKKKPIIKSIKPIRVKKPIPVKTNFKVKTTAPVLPAVKKKPVIKSIKTVVKKPLPSNFNVKRVPLTPSYKIQTPTKPQQPTLTKNNNQPIVRLKPKLVKKVPVANSAGYEKPVVFSPHK